MFSLRIQRAVTKLVLLLVCSVFIISFVGLLNTKKVEAYERDCTIHSDGGNANTNRYLILIPGINTSAGDYEDIADNFTSLENRVDELYEGVIYYSYSMMDSDAYWVTDTYQSVKDISAPLLRDLIAECISVAESGATFDIVGHSLGGYTALYYAKQNTEDIITDGKVKHIIGLHSPFNGTSYTGIVYTLSALFGSIPTVHSALHDLSDDNILYEDTVLTNLDLAYDLDLGGVMLKNLLNVKDQVVTEPDADIDQYSTKFDLKKFYNITETENIGNSHGALKDFTNYPEVGNYLFALLNNASSPEDTIELCDVDVPSTGVILYKDRHCRGSEGQDVQSSEINKNYLSTDSFNNEISSIKVASGWSVKLYLDNQFKLYNTSEGEGSFICYNTSVDWFSSDTYLSSTTLVDNSVSYFEVFDNTNCAYDTLNTSSLGTTSYEITLHSTTTGGLWNSNSTWLEGRTPNANDVVEINGNVEVGTTANQVKGIIIRNTGELDEKTGYSYSLNVSKGIINYGQFNINVITLAGDIYNSGSWYSDGTLNLTGTYPHSIAGTNQISKVYVQNDTTINYNVRLQALYLQGYNVTLNEYTSGNIYSLNGQSGDVLGSGKLTVTGSITGPIDALDKDAESYYGVVSTATFKTLLLKEGGGFDATTNITSNTVTFYDWNTSVSYGSNLGGGTINGNVIVQSGAILEKGTLTVNGNVTNYGKMSSPYDFVYLFISGDIINNGIWNAYRTALIGTNAKSISGSANIEGQLRADADFSLSYSTGIYDLRTNSHILTLTEVSGGLIHNLPGGNIAGSGTLTVGTISGGVTASSKHIDIKGNAYGNITANTIDIQEGGSFDSTTNITAGTITLYNYSSSLTFGRAVNGAVLNGNVVTNSGAIFKTGILYINGTLANSGSMKVDSVYIKGDMDNYGTWAPSITYLDWDDVSGASGYEISLSSNGTTWDTPISTGTNSRYNVGNTIPSSQTKFWKTREIVGGVPGSWSAVRSINN